MLKFFLKGAVIYFHTYKEKLVEWKQIVFIEVKGNKVTKVTFPFTLGKAILDIFTEININRKKILLFVKDDFCDKVLEMTNLHDAGTFQKERQNFYSASDLIKTISIFSWIGCPLQIAFSCFESPLPPWRHSSGWRPMILIFIALTKLEFIL